MFISNNDYVNKFNNTGLNATNNGSNVATNSSSLSPLKLLQDKNSNSSNSSNSSTGNTTSTPGPGDIGYIPTLVSGNRVDFNVYVLDQDGNIYTSDSKSKASLSGSSDLLSSASDDEDDIEIPRNTSASSSAKSQ